MNLSLAGTKTRVLIVEPSGLLWGSERALLDLVRHVDASRYELVVATPTGAPLNPMLRETGAEVVELDIGMLHRKGRTARLRALIQLARTIRRVKPNVVHVNQAGLTALVAAARVGAAIPLVTHVRLWEDAQVVTRNLPRFYSADVVIAISDFIASRLRDASGDKDARSLDVRIVHDPFDATVFVAQNNGGQTSVKEELGVAKSIPIVLMVGRICQEKGQALLFDAAEKFTDGEAMFLFAGGVAPQSLEDSRYFACLQQRAHAGALRGRVQLLGERTDVARLMSAADIVVLTSAHEPFGRVLLEAMSLGKAVVAPDHGGPLEIIGHNERGYLFASGDSAALSQRIRDALASGIKDLERTEKAKTWVEVNCSPQKHAERIQGLWDEVSGLHEIQ